MGVVSSGKKIHIRAILKENTANYISLERLINVDVGKKYELPIVLIPQKKIAKMTAKMTMRNSIKHKRINRVPKFGGYL